MKKNKKIFAILLTLVMIAGSFAGCGPQQQPTGDTGDGEERTVIRLTIGSGHGRELTQWTYAVANHFQPTVAARVAAETNYEIYWVEAWGGAIAGLGEESVAVETGLLDVGCVIKVFEPARFLPHLFTWYMPFGSNNPIAVGAATLQLYDEFPILREIWEGFNQKVLGSLVSDDYNLFSTFLINTVDDIRGERIAAAGANLFWLEGTGATGVASSLAEGYTAMQTGVYDGFINPTIAQFLNRIHEVGPYLLLANFGSLHVANLTINLDTWNSFSPEVQRIFLEEGRNTSIWQHQFTANNFQAMLDELESEYEFVTITQLSPEERARWANMLPNIVADHYIRPLMEQGIDAVAIVERFMELIREAGYEPVREWDLSEFR